MTTNWRTFLLSVVLSLGADQLTESADRVVSQSIQVILNPVNGSGCSLRIEYVIACS